MAAINILNKIEPRLESVFDGVETLVFETVVPCPVGSSTTFSPPIFSVSLNLVRKPKNLRAKNRKNLPITLKVLSEKNIFAEISLEERMGCGIGACLGCATKILEGDSFRYGHVCKDGPVFNITKVEI